MSDPNVSTTPPTVPPPAQGQVRVPAWALGAGLVWGLAASVALGVLWQRQGDLQKAGSAQQADWQVQTAQLQQRTQQFETDAQQWQARLTAAEARLAELSLQRSQLDELMLQVSRSRNEQIVQELESMLILAHQHSEWTGSPQPLISALQAAERRLNRAAPARLAALQRAVTRDLERLRHSSTPDALALADQLDDLVRAVDDLPALNAVGSSGPAVPVAAADIPQASAAPVSPSSSASGPWAAWWARVSGSTWAQLRDQAGALLRVSRIDAPEAALLAPEQGVYLRAHLKLSLLNARMAVLARQTPAAQADLRNALQWLDRYVDLRSGRGVQVRQALVQVQQDLTRWSVPKAGDTLAALNAAVQGR